MKTRTVYTKLWVVFIFFNTSISFGQNLEAKGFDVAIMPQTFFQNGLSLTLEKYNNAKFSIWANARVYAGKYTPELLTGETDLIVLDNYAVAVNGWAIGIGSRKYMANGLFMQLGVLTSRYNFNYQSYAWTSTVLNDLEVITLDISQKIENPWIVSPQAIIGHKQNIGNTGFFTETSAGLKYNLIYSSELDNRLSSGFWNFTYSGLAPVISFTIGLKLKNISKYE